MLLSIQGFSGIYYRFCHFPIVTFLPSKTIGLHESSIAGDAYHVDAPGLAPSGFHAYPTYLFSCVAVLIDLWLLTKKSKQNKTKTNKQKNKTNIKKTKMKANKMVWASKLKEAIRFNGIVIDLQVRVVIRVTKYLEIESTYPFLW